MQSYFTNLPPSNILTNKKVIKIFVNFQQNRRASNCKIAFTDVSHSCCIGSTCSVFTTTNGSFNFYFILIFLPNKIQFKKCQYIVIKCNC